MHSTLNLSKQTQQLQTNAETTAASFFHALKGDDGEMITEMRKSDGYINATKLCQSSGKPSKTWSNYIKVEGHKAYIHELESALTIGRALLIQSSATGSYEDRGTWVHPRIATHLAQWISAIFAVKVSGLIDRYVRGDITTEESHAAANIVNRSSNTVTLATDIEVIVRPKPTCDLQSAGFRNPDDLMRGHVYLGLVGPDLTVIQEEVGQHLMSGESNEDRPPNYFDIIRMGKTDNFDANPQRKRAHDVAFGGNFKILDWIGCHQPGVIESKAFNVLTQHNRRIVSKSSKKNTNDMSCFRPNSQDEYNHFVATLARWAVEHDLSLTDNALLVEKERTAQENAKIVQLDRQVRLKELELEIMRLAAIQQPPSDHSHTIPPNSEDTQSAEQVPLETAETETTTTCSKDVGSGVFTHGDIRRFIDETCIYTEDGMVACRSLLHRFNAWQKAKGFNENILNTSDPKPSDPCYGFNGKFKKAFLKSFASITNLSYTSISRKPKNKGFCGIAIKRP